MQKRRFGRTNHESTLAIFGAAAFSKVTQQEADQTMEMVIASGINHIDVAPSYGHAEKLLGPWMETERDRFFLGCKTMERTKNGAHDELRRSLDLLRTDSFDLYQFHSVGNMADLDLITSPGGALEAVVKAQEEGLLKYIGITGHGLEVPGVLLEALQRFDFASVLFPINFILYGDPDYKKLAEELLVQCASRDIGSMIIKSIARGPWGDKPRAQATWYQPFTDLEMIQKGINFTLSQPVTGICTTGDIYLLPSVIEACENFQELIPVEQSALITSARDYEPLSYI